MLPQDNIAVNCAALFMRGVSYLHSFPESVQFPQSPGSGPDILVTGSCRSLCTKREKKSMENSRKIFEMIIVLIDVCLGKSY